MHKNIRCIDEEFSKLLLKIGDGDVDDFEIPNSWITENVCSKIYENVDYKYWKNRVILAPHNDDMNVLNNTVLKLLPGNIKTYYSIDYATYKGFDQTEDNIYLNYPVEVLNEIREGLPPHELNLKVDAIVMLIRNLSVTEGLCNGTRLRIHKLYNYNLEAEIITGENIGKRVFIPKIKSSTNESSNFPFILHRKQFPLILAFCMTINKSQGQSYDSVGLYINRPLFSHGQLYVALSRCRNHDKIYIQNVSKTKNIIKNIVWKEIYKN